ncbi:MAG: S8 family serine peptidase, partial [Planctomycetes bacterium]|nr:S8 family serine peptidase [Planctomycetota bacterium]
PPDLDRIYSIKINPESNRNIQQLLAAYRQNPDVEYAELNHVISITNEPNDTHFPLQWALNNTGQIYPESGRYNHPPGTPNSDIDAPQAWNLHTQSAQTIVAVIDTGVDYTHRDLINNMWINQWEDNGAPGIDDDGNGYTDDIYGYDFDNYDSDPRDDHGHGTHCSGTIGAQANNGLDIAGVNWNGRVMAVKFLDSTGNGSSLDASRAIYYAVNQGADVLSNSWGDTENSAIVAEAIEYAQSQGVTIVAAAGNNNTSQFHYPAHNDHVIAVAATDSNDNKATFSNYGDWVDLAAPGVDILSLRATNLNYSTSYDTYTAISSGTSMACPYVAGVCGFLLSVNPLLDSDQLLEILTQSGDPTAAGITWSNSRLNLANALGMVTPPDASIAFDKRVYSRSSEISITLSDGNYTDPNSPKVTLKSTGVDTEKLDLTKTNPIFSIYRGQIFTGLTPGDPNDEILQVTDGETVTVEYLDYNDGTGQAILVQDSAIIDGVAPTLLNLQIMPAGQNPRILLETDEPTQVQVRFGRNCLDPNEFVRYGVIESSSHQVDFTGVDPNTMYFFIIEMTDSAGNVTLADNGGSCYSFTTTEPGMVRVPADYATIQAAIISSWDGGEVWVADGIYTGSGNRDIDFCGREIVVRSESGPHDCIIDCEGSNGDPHRGFEFYRGEGLGSVLEGFTITNGYALNGNGGGIIIVRSSPTIQNCILMNNSTNYEDETGHDSGGYGGGIYTYYGSAEFINCEFIGNSANYYNLSTSSGVEGGYGGGVYNYYSNVTLMNCEFVSNRAWAWDTSPFGVGGGMRNYYSDSTLIGCRFWGNSAQEQGGGMGNYNSHVTLTNSMFSGNTVEFNGGGIYSDGVTGVLEMANCTIADNTAGIEGGGIANYTFADLVSANCIFWGNRDGNGVATSGQISENLMGVLSVNYSCVEDYDPNDGIVFSGDFNIDDDPCFVDAAGGDYHLQSQAGRWDPNMACWVFDPNTSKAVDTGDPDSDWSSELWPHGGCINMGVYGGTVQASMSLSTMGNVADLNHDGIVNWEDWVLLSEKWLRAEVLQAADLDRNGVVDLGDLWMFSGEWLWRK